MTSRHESDVLSPSPAPVPATRSPRGLPILTPLALACALAPTLGAGVPIPAQRDLCALGSREHWRESNRRAPSSPDTRASTPGRSGFLSRAYDGADNNLAHPEWGSAGTNYLREASGAHYADGISWPAGAMRPSPRVISNTIVAQGEDKTEESRGLSTCVYEFGQFLDHDIGLAAGGSEEGFDIAVPAGDPYFDPAWTGAQWIYLDRSAFDPATGVLTPRQQVNTVTAYIDGSQIYGSDALRAAWLRSFEGGHLKSRSTEIGELLPFNDGTLANDNPVGLPPTMLLVSGDVRTNEQPGLTALHTVFLREHNWHADRLHEAHPEWTDEQLYQEARRFVIAELQVVVYNEFLPALLGWPMPAYAGYRPDVNAGLSNLFAAAAYRIGHSMVGPDIGVINEDFEEIDSLPLAAIFFNPLAIPSIGGINPIIRYFAVDTEQEIDTKIVDPLRNFLFGQPGQGGFDLASLNIQRGRDHGLADYNTARADYGLPRVTAFDQITSNPALASQLESLYGTVDDIDAWVGMLAEDHLPGSSLGETHTAILVDQFVRLRDGDRYWYQINGFSPAELAELESTALSDIFTRTTGITGLQAGVFFAEELHTPACPGDTDGDRTVGLADIAPIIQCWGMPGSCNPGADHDGNETIGLGDIASVILNWGNTCP